MPTCNRCGADTTQSTLADTLLCADCREALAERDGTRPEGQLGLGDAAED